MFSRVLITTGAVVEHISRTYTSWMEAWYPLDSSCFLLPSGFSQPAFLLLFLWVWLFWMTHISGIVWHLCFCVWLISLIWCPPGLSTLSHVVKCSSLLRLFNISPPSFINLSMHCLHTLVLCRRYNDYRGRNTPLRPWFQLLWTCTQKWVCWIIQSYYQ